MTRYSSQLNVVPSPFARVFVVLYRLGVVALLAWIGLSLWDVTEHGVTAQKGPEWDGSTIFVANWPDPSVRVTNWPGVQQIAGTVSLDLPVHTAADGSSFTALPISGADTKHLEIIGSVFTDVEFPTLQMVTVVGDHGTEANPIVVRVVPE